MGSLLADLEGPGLPYPDLSVNTNMVLSDMPSWKLFNCSSAFSLSFGSKVVRFGMKKTSWISEISGEMTIC